MDPVKKWSILVCLVLTLAGAGVWLSKRPSVQDEADAIVSSEPSQEIEVETQLSKHSETSEEVSTKEVNDQLTAVRTVQHRTEARKPNSKKIFESQGVKEETVDNTELDDSETVAATEKVFAAPDHSQISSPSVKIEESAQRSIWLTLGGGLGFSSLSQDVPGASELNVGKFSAPFLFVEIGAWLTKVFGLEVRYQSLPGKVLSSPSLTVSKEDYTWKTMSAEANYKLYSLGSGSDEWIIRAGVQQQEIPFLHPQGPTVISSFENSLTTASIGVHYRRKLEDKIFFESLVRYQHPINSTSVAGASFSTHSSLLLDGDIGATYGLSQNFSLGGYWSVQYLSYHYRFTDSVSVAENGKQTLIQSNLSLRLKWEF